MILKTFSPSLERTLRSLNQKFKTCPVTRLAEAQQMGVQYCSSGIPNLDAILGGGFPKGRLVEIYGQPSSGKTALALQTIAQVQSTGGTAALIDLENALDPEFAAILGVDLDTLVMVRPDTAKAALTIVEQLVASKVINLVVLDSVAALPDSQDAEDKLLGTPPRPIALLMDQAMRRLMHWIHPDCTIVFLNQMRHRHDVVYGSPEAPTGGRALRNYASLRLECRMVKPIGASRNNPPQGIRLTVKVTKNKVAPPFRTVELDLMFSGGFVGATTKSTAQPEFDQLVQELAAIGTLPSLDP